MSYADPAGARREGGSSDGKRSGVFATKDVARLLAETEEEGTRLRKAVGALDLTALGIGAIIGTGIFVIIGEAIALSGPAIVLAFVVAGITCIFSALSYAELASTIPVAGSAHTYSYATMGELMAWIIGWDLILERGYRVPFVPVFPLIGIALCVWLMTKLDAATWGRFGAWLLLGVVIYAVYGYRHSRLRKG